MDDAQGWAGQAGGWLFEPTLNRSIQLRNGDPHLTCDAGALLLREVDYGLGLTATAQLPTTTSVAANKCPLHGIGNIQVSISIVQRFRRRSI